MKFALRLLHLDGFFKNTTYILPETWAYCETWRHRGRLTMFGKASHRAPIFNKGKNSETVLEREADFASDCIQGPL
jgi:hypothetical protein